MKFSYYLFTCAFLASQLALGQVAVNDTCTDATVIAVPNFGATNYFAVDTRNATPSLPSPDCTDSSADDDVWYAFEASSDGLIFRYRNAVLPAGSSGVGYNILDGCTGAQIGCNFTFGDGTTGSEVADLRALLVPGQTYLFRVFAQGPGGGTFEFGIQAYQQNDECLGAAPISVIAPGACSFTNISTTNFGRSFTPPSFCATTSNNDDGWYRFTASSEYILLNYENMVVANGTSTGLGYSLHDGCSGMEIACDFSFGNGIAGSTIGNPLQAINLGQEYLIRLYLEGNTSSGSLDFCLQESVCRPPTIRYEAIFDSCATIGPKVVVTVLDLGSGDSLIIENDGGTAPLVFKTTGKDTTDAFSGQAGYTFTAVNQLSATCNLVEVVNVFCPASNQTCETALPLNINDPGSCTSFNEAKNWYAATSEFPLDPSCGFYDGGDLFYTFTAPTPTLVFELLESPFSTLAITVNTLDCNDGGLEVDCQTIRSNTGTRVITGLTPGDEYIMRIFDRGNDDFGIATFCVQADISLPAELTRFSGKAALKSNQLDWTTASEAGLSHFAVQVSTDAVTEWTTVGKALATNGTEAVAYTFHHTDPSQHSYYRLVMNDYDGTLAYSPVVQISRQQPGGLASTTIAPNPTSNSIFLNIPEQPGVLTVSLLEITGRQISSERITPEEGQNHRLDLSALKPGIYLVNIHNGTETLTRRIVRSR